MNDPIADCGLQGADCGMRNKDPDPQFSGSEHA
jgi:hypothetical protein